MKQELNLVEILKGCPKGTKLYSPIYGEVVLDCIDSDNKYPIDVITKYGNLRNFTSDGLYDIEYNGECMLFPSKDQRDWSKFVAPKPDLPEGTWVMCSDRDGLVDWILRRYHSNGSCHNPYSSCDFYAWKCIIPLDKFDPNNIEYCIKKYNYGTKQ